MRRSAAGAIAAQGAQALASFVLQVLVARTLGLDALGAFAILYGVVVLASGIVSGFVGDSLVVLPRHERPVRSALEQWGLLLATGSGLVGAALTTAVGLTTLIEGGLFAVATTVFCLKEVVRRTLMAELLFWRVTVVDLAGLVVALGVLGGGALSGTLSLAVFLGALAAGQVVALVAAILLLPRAERYAVRFVGGGRRAVARYGVWRSLQQLLRPALLTAVRGAVLVAVGLAATGLLEAARTYAAPALLLVTGLSSFLFASFARQLDQPVKQRMRRADRAMLALIGMTALLGGVAVLVLPVAGPLLFGTTPDLAAVLGWLAFTVAVAATTPYGSLAATGGRQAVVFGVRVADTLVSFGAVVLGLALGMDASWAPVVLAGGALAGGLAIRLLVLPRLARSTASAAPQALSTATASA